MSQSAQVKLEDKLRSMKNRTFLYNTMTVKVLSWKYEGEYCTLVTSGPWPVQPIRDMLKLVNDEFLEVEEEDEPQNGNTPAKSEAEAVLMPNLKGLNVCDGLLDNLMDNITKVSENKDYTEQAGKVADLAGKVIGITKVQLEAFRFANELHRNR